MKPSPKRLRHVFGIEGAASGSGARAASQVVRVEAMSTLDAELNDFGAHVPCSAVTRPTVMGRPKSCGAGFLLAPSSLPSSVTPFATYRGEVACLLRRFGQFCVPGRHRSSSIARKNLPAASEQNHLCRIHNTRRATERWARGGPSEYWDAPSARHLPRPDEVPAGVCGRTAGRIRRRRLRPGAGIPGGAYATTGWGS